MSPPHSTLGRRRAGPIYGNHPIPKGGGQSANHTCCKRHQNVELQFITVQAMQEDDDGNGLILGKADVAAVLRAKREIQPGESIRYQYTDCSEQLENIFECECCLHVGPCQPLGQKMFARARAYSCMCIVRAHACMCLCACA